MIKPFYNKKKNIDNRLVPAVSPSDAGKVLGVTEDGKIAPVEGGGGGPEYVFLYANITENDRDIIFKDFGPAIDFPDAPGLGCSAVVYQSIRSWFDDIIEGKKMVISTETMTSESGITQNIVLARSLSIIEPNEYSLIDGIYLPSRCFSISIGDASLDVINGRVCIGYSF